VPAAASGVLLIPRLEEAAKQAAALHATLAALPGTGELGQLRTVLGAQLSFDLFDPVSLGGVGLDVTRGLAVVELLPPSGEEVGLPLLVLPVSDPGKLDALLVRLAKDRLGAGERGQENANGRTIDVWRRAAGEPTLLAAASLDGLALVSAGPSGPEAIRAALKLDPALSLEQSPGWGRARAALGGDSTFLFWVPPGSPTLASGPPLDGVVGGVSASAGGLRLVGVALLGQQEARLRPLAGPGPGRSEPLAVGPDALLAVRLSAQPSAALHLLGEVTGAEPSAPLAAVAAALAPPIDLGVSLSPRAEPGLALASRGQLEPLRLLRIEVATQVSPGSNLGPTLDALARTAHGAGKGGRWTVPLGPETEVAWSLTGTALRLAAGPRGSLDAAAARPGGFTAPTPASTEALSGGLGGLVFHPDNLARAVKALPPEAWGTGPDAVMGRSLAERLTAPGGRHAAISLRADLPAGALRLALEVELGQPAKAP
jgi:hypothetical protein